MNTKIMIAMGVVVLVAAGALVLDSLEKNRGYVDPLDEPGTLSSDFALTPIGGGTFNVGENIKAGFTMTYTGNVEDKNNEESRFFVDEATVFATSNNDATSPNGKAIVPVNSTADMNGEVMTFDLVGYSCVKEGDVSIIFRNILTRYDIAGVPQTDRYDREAYWGEDVFVSMKCVEQEMVQIEPPKVILQAGSAPLGQNESETGFLHEDGNRYYNGERVDNEGTILDDLE